MYYHFFLTALQTGLKMSRELEGETLTSVEDAAAVLSACLPLGWEVFQVLLEAGVSPLHRCLPRHLHLQPPVDWGEASLPLAGVWEACPAVHQVEEDWELSSWQAFPCEEGASHPASAACLGMEKGLFQACRQ